MLLIFVFSVDLNTQLKDQKIIVHQHRQPSADNQNVLTAEEAFFTFKSDFTEVERRCIKALIQLSHIIGMTKDLIAKLSDATCKVFERDAGYEV